MFLFVFCWLLLPRPPIRIATTTSTLYSSSSSSSSSLSSSSSIKRIALVGGGISSCSLASSLLQQPSQNYEIDIFESRPKNSRESLIGGGGIQLNGGGAVLSRILTPENFKSFVSNSQRMEQVVSRRSSYDKPRRTSRRKSSFCE